MYSAYIGLFALIGLNYIQAEHVTMLKKHQSKLDVTGKIVSKQRLRNEEKRKAINELVKYDTKVVKGEKMKKKREELGLPYSMKKAEMEMLDYFNGDTYPDITNVTTPFTGVALFKYFDYSAACTGTYSYSESLSFGECLTMPYYASGSQMYLIVNNTLVRGVYPSNTECEGQVSLYTYYSTTTQESPNCASEVSAPTYYYGYENDHGASELFEVLPGSTKLFDHMPENEMWLAEIVTNGFDCNSTFEFQANNIFENYKCYPRDPHSFNNYFGSWKYEYPTVKLYQSLMCDDINGPMFISNITDDSCGINGFFSYGLRLSNEVPAPTEAPTMAPTVASTGGTSSSNSSPITTASQRGRVSGMVIGSVLGALLFFGIGFCTARASGKKSW